MRRKAMFLIAFVFAVASASAAFENHKVNPKEKIEQHQTVVTAECSTYL